MKFNNLLKIEELSAPIYVHYEVTPVCNWRCQFCCIAEEMKKLKHPSLEFSKRIVDEIRKNDVLMVTFLGGEPTTFPKIDELIRYSYDIGLFCEMITNGMSMNEKVMDALNYAEAGIGVSIHASNSKLHDKITTVKGSWEKTVQNLKKIASKKISISLNFTAMSMNYKDVYKYVEFFSRNFPIDGISINRFILAGYGKNRKDLQLSVAQLNELASEIDKANRDFKLTVSFGDAIPLCILKEEYHYLTSRCTTGSTYCCITPEGNLKLCNATQMVLGNILDKSIKELWQQPKLKEFRSLKWLPIKCLDCKYLKRCLGGCIFSNPKFNERIYSYDHYLDIVDKKC